jgi:hypothetical protein
MATTASERPAPAEEGKSADQTFWRRISRPLLFWRRLPTALVVTLIGLGLSAWLLPAITRQWDDRQKAHELQASIVTDMATATAQVLGEGEALHASGRALAGNEGSRSIEWSRARLQMEARLHAYFPSEIVETWQLYSYFVSFFEPAAHTAGEGSYALDAAADYQHRLENSARPSSDALIESVHDLAIAAAILDRSRRNEDVLGTVFYPMRGDNYLIAQYSRLPIKQKYNQFEVGLLNLESIIADQVLAANPKGYSTTLGDLLHDLVP